MTITDENKAKEIFNKIKEPKKVNIINESLNEEPTYDLGTRYDSRQSFYGKARVDVKDNKQVLYSYGTPVCMIKGGDVTLLPHWSCSQTTLRHVKEFLKQNGYDDKSKYNHRRE